MAAVDRQIDPIFAASGEMAARCAEHDWSGTPLGLPATWSESLRTAVAMVLRSRFPMILSWGHEFVILYNDAFIPTLGAKHPGALGGLLSYEFAEVWDEVGPMQRSVLAGGDATFHEDLPLLIERGGGLEETYFTFSYSHVPADPGPGGVIAVLAVTTGAVVGTRRMALLNELAAQGPRADSPTAALSSCLMVLGQAEADLSHGACYLPDGPDRLVMTGAFGTLPDDWPTEIDLKASSPAAGAWAEGETAVDHRRPPGATSGAAETTVSLPLHGREGSTSAMLLVVPNALRPLDQDHHHFLDLVGDQVSQVLTLATARADEHARVSALAEIDAAKTAFLSNVSHEFRTPLTLVLGPLEDALAGHPGALDRAEVESMYASAHRLLRMVNALLDVARLDSGTRAEPDLEPLDLGEVTDELVAPFSVAAGRAGLEFTAEIDDELGRLLLDPERWESIVLNLLANAIKYTPAGSINLSLGADGDDVLLRVSDTGIGISAADVDHVFDRFYRAGGGQARSIEGTGIGLSLVHDAARSLGGTVTVASEPGRGSTFEVRLPLVRAPLAEAADTEQTRRRAFDPGPGRGRDARPRGRRSSARSSRRTSSTSPPTVRRSWWWTTTPPCALV